MKVNNKKGVAGISTAIKVLMSVVLGGLVLISIYGIVNQKLKNNYKDTHVLQAGEIDKGITELVQKQESAIQLGDINQNKTTDYEDLTYLQHFLAGWKGYSVELKYGDMNKDGVIDKEDEWALEDLLDSVALGNYDKDAQELNPGKNNKNLPAGSTYNRGGTSLDKFPDVPNTNDVFVYHDYKYIYNGVCSGTSDISNDTWTNKAIGGWSVRVSNRHKAAYSPILTSINNKPVVNADYAFYDCGTLKMPPVIPATVKSMNYAFSGCVTLKRMPNIPDGITSLNNTFAGCKSMETLRRLPDSISSLYATFQDCSKIIFVPNLPQNLTDMSKTFLGCTSLKTVPDIPNNVRSMGETFYNCSSLITSPKISEKTSYMSQTYYNCVSLISAPKIPDSVSYMWNAFRGCKSLKHIPNIPMYVTNLDFAFADSGLKEVNCIIPPSVTSMNGTFSGCTSLKGTIAINSNINSYGSCFNKTEEPIRLAKGNAVNDSVITNLMLSANRGNVYCDGFVPNGGEYYTEKGEKFSACSKMPAIIKDGDKFIYGDYEYRYNYFFGGFAWRQNSTQNGWGVRVLDTTKTGYGKILESINNKPIVNMTWTFYSCASLMKAPEIPKHVENMTQTFYGCSSITEAPAIPNGVMQMTGVFQDCLSLTTAPVIPANVTSIIGAFSGCKSLTGNINVYGNPKGYVDCFRDTVKRITLLQGAGAKNQTIKNLLSTANNRNVYCNGY